MRISDGSSDVCSSDLSERDDRRTWHEGERMSDTAVAAATPDPDPTGNVSTPPAHLPGESSMWFFVIGDLFIFAVYFVLYMVYRGQHHALFLQSQQHLNQGIAVIKDRKSTRLNSSH